MAGEREPQRRLFGAGTHLGPTVVAKRGFYCKVAREPRSSSRIPTLRAPIGGQRSAIAGALAAGDGAPAPVASKHVGPETLYRFASRAKLLSMAGGGCSYASVRGGRLG